MNIEMINNQNANRGVDVDRVQYSNPSTKDSRMKTEQIGYSLDITGKVMENASYGKEELKSAQDIALEASQKNVTLDRNYKAVMSNSMSKEDFAKLCADGVNPVNTTVEESVTNLDKIKITMAEAGVTIEGYNDESKIGDILRDADLPYTKENIEAASEALMIAMNLNPLSDEAMKYMINEDMEPTIDNVYKAQHSSGAYNGYAGQTAVYSGIGAFASKADSNTEWDNLENQAAQIVEEASISDKEQGLSDAKWLVENQIPLTSTTLEKYTQLKNVELPANKEDVMKSIVSSIEEGYLPIDANLANTESLYDKAVRLVSDFSKYEDGGDIHKRRLLEEVRLAMTTEANLTLLRKGISIETEPLEMLVEELKEAEKEFYKPLLEAATSDEQSNIDNKLSLDEKIDLYKASRSVIDDIPNIPVEAVARTISESNEANDFTIGKVYEEGVALRSAYERAGETYEALMTAPRADMGDSIRRAFANVDDILEDLDMDINEANQKAVRTLGYANMDINRENIDRIREATMDVSRVAALLTPAKTLQMIRDGHNPLNDSIKELTDYLSDDTPSEESEKYSEYLYKLEKNNQITEDEKSAYIGMYRLLRQIEKQDGRVIGNVLSSGQELTMANMLSASRSNKHKNMDVKIDDDFGVLDEVIAKGESISEQISQVFNKMMSDKMPEDYVEEKLNDIKRAVRKKDSVEEVLDSINEPATIANVLVATDMVDSFGVQVKRLFTNDGKPNSNTSNIDRSRKDRAKTIDNDLLADEDIDELIDGFENKEEALAAYEKYIEKAIQIASKREKNADKYIDVRNYSSMYKQLSFAAALANKEAYDVPIRTKNGVTNIHLTIEHASTSQGVVTASLNDEEYGKVTAKFTLKSNAVDGFIVSDSRIGVSELSGERDAIEKAFEAAGFETKNLSIVYSNTIGKSDFIPDNDEEVTNNQLYKIAKAFITTLSK